MGDGIRIYECEHEGRIYKLPSATTILDCASKPALLFFYAKHGATKAKEIAAEASAIGTSFHGYAQSFFLKDKSVNVTGDITKIRNCIANFHKIVEQYGLKPVELDGKPAVEITVFSIEHLYAGTFDGLFVTKDGRIVLIDWKTSSSIYETYTLQGEAYYRAMRERYPKVMIDEIWIVRLDKESLVNFDKDILMLTPDEKNFKGFLGLRDYFYWTQYLKDTKKEKKKK